MGFPPRRPRAQSPVGNGSHLEAVTTPMSVSNTGEVFGAMVLCFVPRSSDGGVWLAVPGLSGIGLAEARQAIATVTAGAGPSERSARLEINEVAHHLFCQTFDSTKKSPAWHIALYPLARTSRARMQPLACVPRRIRKSNCNTASSISNTPRGTTTTSWRVSLRCDSEIPIPPSPSFTLRIPVCNGMLHHALLRDSCPKARPHSARPRPSCEAGCLGAS